eukprot:9503873-Alexandrium_andersonii.AAC.1
MRRERRKQKPFPRTRQSPALKTCIQVRQMCFFPSATMAIREGRDGLADCLKRSCVSHCVRKAGRDCLGRSG